jgi:hypothetical protein
MGWLVGGGVTPTERSATHRRRGGAPAPAPPAAEDSLRRALGRRLAETVDGLEAPHTVVASLESRKSELERERGLWRARQMHKDLAPPCWRTHREAAEVELVDHDWFLLLCEGLAPKTHGAPFSPPREKAMQLEHTDPCARVVCAASCCVPTHSGCSCSTIALNFRSVLCCRARAYELHKSCCTKRTRERTLPKACTRLFFEQQLHLQRCIHAVSTPS